MVSAKYLITGVSFLLAVSATPVPQNLSGSEVAKRADETPVEAEYGAVTPISESTSASADDANAESIGPLEKRCFLGLCKLFGGGSSGGSSSVSSNTCSSSSCSTQCTQGTMTCAMLKVKRTILG